MRNKPRIKKSDLLISADVSALFRACRQMHQRALIELLLDSGCRIGEALNMTVNDIESEDNFLIVTLDGKTGERTIPLLKANIPMFMLYLSTVSGDRIFPFSYIAINKQFRRLYERAGVKRPKRMLHIFRHMKATHLLEANVPETIIKRFMGWSGGSDMVGYYSHLNTRSLTDYFARHYGVATEPHEELYPKDERERLKDMLS